TSAVREFVSDSVSSNSPSGAEKRQSSKIALLLSIAFILTVNLPQISLGQTKKAESRKKSSQKSAPTVAEQVAKAKADLISAAKDYKKSLATLLALQEADVKSASELVEKRKILLEQSVISKKELEESEHTLATAQDKV